MGQKPDSDGRWGDTRQCIHSLYGFFPFEFQFDLPPQAIEFNDSLGIQSLQRHCGEYHNELSTECLKGRHRFSLFTFDSKELFGHFLRWKFDDDEATFDGSVLFGMYPHYLVQPLARMEKFLA